MATLGKIRKHGALLVTSIAVALFLFVAGDLFRGGQTIFQSSQQVVAEIAGEEVQIQDFQKQVEELTGYYEIMQQRNLSGEDELNHVKDETWETLVQTKLVKAECDKLGLTVTDDEVAEVLKTGQSQLLQVPLFMNQQTGRYDYAIVQDFLASYAQMKASGMQMNDAYIKAYNYYMFAQKQIRTQYLTQKFQVLLSKLLISNPIEAKMSFEARDNETDVVLASLAASSVNDEEVEVSDADIKAKYDEDKQMYKQIYETRDVRYIDVIVTPSEADRAAAEANMKEAAAALEAAKGATNIANVCRQNASALQYVNVMKAKEAYPQMISAMLDSAVVGATIEPMFDVMTNAHFTFRLVDKKTEADSVQYQRIVVGGDDAKAALATADSIVNAVKGGEAFADMAKKYNQEADSMWIATANYQNSLMEADDQLLVNTVYGMQAGEVKSIALSNGYNIILKVIEKRNPIVKYNVAAIVKQLNFSDETYNAAYNKLSSFLAANNTAEAIEANADKEGYSLLSLNDIVNNQHNIAGIHNTRDALKWAFDTAKPGDVSQLYECGSNNHLLVVTLDAVNKEGYRPIAKVSEQIKAELTQEKKIAKLAEKFQGVTSIADAKAKGAQIDTVKHISFAAPTFVRSTAASEPLLSAAASKAAKGEFVGPVKGNAAAYVMQVIDKKQIGEKFDVKQEEATAAQANIRMALQNIINTLYLRAGVVDKRYKFF